MNHRTFADIGLDVRKDEAVNVRQKQFPGLKKVTLDKVAIAANEANLESPAMTRLPGESRNQLGGLPMLGRALNQAMAA